MEQGDTDTYIEFYSVNNSAEEKSDYFHYSFHLLSNVVCFFLRKNEMKTDAIIIAFRQKNVYNENGNNNESNKFHGYITEILKEKKYKD